jgi:hypothetical protein
MVHGKSRDLIIHINLTEMKKYRVNSIRVFLILQFVLILNLDLNGQAASEIKEIFTQAESYYIYEEYELANQLYLLIESPDNMNIKHKIGTCYLNIPGEKEKSFPYLEEAVKSASFDSKTESFKEMRAPLDVYFSLAKAYMINNEFEKALDVLQNFSRIVKQTGSASEVVNLEFIDQQILACKNAINFRQVPVFFGKELLGNDFSMGSINENPAVSFDGNVIVYTERRGIESAIFYSRKTGGKWEAPIEITTELNAGKDCSSSSLNADGSELLLYKTDNYDGAIYSSKFVDGKWTPIKKLNKNINTKFYESHASFSADGKKLYFASNREGGFGNLDIYVSDLDASGNWGPATNLGKDINTPFNEDTPFITANDSLLYFSSEGHNSMGGYDNYKSLHTSSGWKAPSNLGFPVNSADDDKFFQPYNNGKSAFYSMTTGYKKKEIFQLDMTERERERPYLVTGKIIFMDTLAGGMTGNVRMVDRITGDTLYRCTSDNNTGSYSLNVSPGLFRIFYSGKGYFSQSIDTLIIPGSAEMAMNIDISLVKDTASSIEPVKYEKIDLQKIPVVAEVDTSLLIKNMNVNDEADKKVSESEILYFTVQVIALHKPVDATYFKYINDIKIMYNDDDKFYRYTTGQYQSRDEAYSHRTDLIRKGYPKQIFVKKVSKQAN